MAVPERRIIAVLVALVIVVVVGFGVVRRTPEGAETVRDAVPPIPSVHAADLGPLTQNGRVVARDDGQSTRYGDRSAWVFADTVLRDPEGFLSNSAASTRDLRAADGITLTSSDVFGTSGRDPAALFGHTPAEAAFQQRHATGCTPAGDVYCGASFAFWPGPVIADPHRARLLVFYTKLCRSGAEGTPCSGPFGRALGTGILAVDLRTREIRRLPAERGQDVRSIEGPDPTMFFPPSAAYAAAAVVVGDDVYVYGDCDSVCRLARAPLDRITDRLRWRFWTGTGWSSNPDRAVGTIRAGSAGNTVFYDPALEGWLNVYLPGVDDTIRAQIGGSPTGPWSAAFPILTTSGRRPNYAAFAHPEYAEHDGLTQYLTYFHADSGELRLTKVTFEP
ncbi:DUF4185 domain-containing protein [Cryptosporangium phraense]|uniref:DUF4185 domain-containing protein n=1 Tax=Cryptosporangium phraense TaxID=2593070 RepID=A0A545AXD7_9ACTN|nr:DUF4185 domain-containing protein [Cryptosporangium phraense]TQS45996.1 DUF4185 domain-containing protein [Cryptosporangium phraense]